MVERIEVRFPGLRNSQFHFTSPATRCYNCIAWAAGDTQRWWWPDTDSENNAAYWPRGAPREETVEAFVAAFAALGYISDASEEFQSGFEKLALFAIGSVPTHAARQLSNGRWSSKLGMREDIEHDLHALSGEAYGRVVLILKRPIR